MWWQQTSALENWLDDFLRDAMMRRGLGHILADGSANAHDLLSAPRDFGFSSLDMLTLASRFATCLGIERTGLEDLLLARRSADGWLAVAQRSLAIDDSQMRFYSSGSTGAPAVHSHKLSLLLRETEHFQAILTPACRIVSLVPCHHIYGFIWGVLLAQTMGVAAIRINPATTLPSSWCRRLQENDLIVATPDLWSMVVDTQAAMPSGFTAVSSTAPLNPKTAHALLALYPGITLTEVYGSSETAGIAWRQNHSRQFTLLPYWELLQQGSDWVLKDKQHGTRHVLNDRLEQLDSHGFVVRGRRDRVVQIGGHNIDLAELEKRLCTHPDVREARVRSEQCDSGVVLHYFLALKSLPNKPINWCPAFSLWLNAVLGDLPPPASVVIGDEIPVGTLDKKISWQHTDYPVCHGVYHLSR